MAFELFLPYKVLKCVQSWNYQHCVYGDWKYIVLNSAKIWLNRDITVYENVAWYALKLRSSNTRDCRPGPRLNIKMSSYQHGDPHYKDKTVSRPSYLYNGNQYTQERRSLYWNALLAIIRATKLVEDSSPPRVETFSVSKTFHKNIRSWVKNECECSRLVDISNVNFITKIPKPPKPVFQNKGRQMSRPGSSNGWSIRRDMNF